MLAWLIGTWVGILAGCVVRQCNCMRLTPHACPEHVCLLRCFYHSQLTHAGTSMVCSDPVAEDIICGPSSISTAITLDVQAGSYLLKPKAATKYDALDISADMDDSIEPPLGKGGKPLPAMVEVLPMAPPWAKYPDYEKVGSWAISGHEALGLASGLREAAPLHSGSAWLSGGVGGRRLLLSNPLAELQPVASSLQRWQSPGRVQPAAEPGGTGYGGWHAWTCLHQTALRLSHGVTPLLCT